jgi:hypothetical protein
VPFLDLHAVGGGGRSQSTSGKQPPCCCTGDMAKARRLGERRAFSHDHTMRPICHRMENAP